MKVLIAGCGDLGGLIGQLLTVEGHEVWGARRDAERTPGSLHALSVDLLDDGLAEVLPGGIEAVVFTMAPADRSVAAYQATYGRALANLLDALSGQPRLRRMLLVTSTRVWRGAPDHPWVDEATPADPIDPQGEILLAAEGLVRDCLGAERALSLRLGGIYGPGRSWILDRLRAGTLELVSPAPPINWIHRHDAARAVFELLLIDAPPPVVAGCDGQPLSQLEVARALATDLGLQLPGIEEAAPRPAKRVAPTALRELGFDFRFRDAIAGHRDILAGEKLAQELFG